MRYRLPVRLLPLAASLLAMSVSMASAQQGPEGQDATPEAPRGGAGSSPEDPGAAARPPEDPEAAREARERFQAGMEHFQERRFREAIREFELAGQRVPSADLWFNIARAHEELSEYDRAVEYYQRYLRDRVDPPDRARIEGHIEGLERRAEEQRLSRRQTPTTGTLRISTTVDGSQVSIDGRQLGTAPVPAPLSLAPGRHRLTVRHDGHVPFRSEVRIEAGVTTAAHADLQPATEYRSVHGSRLFTWIAGGLAVAAAGTSVYFGARAASVQGDARDAGSMAEQSMLLEDAGGWATRSDVALGAAVALAVTAVVLWFVEGRAVATERVEATASVELD